MKLVWQCDACGLRGPANSEAIVERLQQAGLLKRAAKEERQDQAYLLAVAESAGARLACPACGAAGLHLGDEQQHDPFDGSRPCAACGQAIPAERFELFPETTLCVACQSKVDQGAAPDTQEYCPRCGNPLQVRLRHGAGVARYGLVCPQCRR